MYEPKDVVSTEAEVREVLGEVLYSQDTKVIDHIDDLEDIYLSLNRLEKPGKRWALDELEKGIHLDS